MRRASRAARLGRAPLAAALALSLPGCMLFGASGQDVDVYLPGDAELDALAAAEIDAANMDAELARLAAEIEGG